jgi:general secretion pathway protein F
VARFRYEAVSNAGQTLAGEMEALSERAVIERLQELGHLPVRAEAVASSTAKGALPRDMFGRRRLAPRALAIATRELATLLEAGLPLDRSLEILVQLSETEAVRGLFARVLDRVRGGSTLADAMAEQQDAFPRYYVGMVRAAEAGGSLDAVMARLAGLIEKSQTLREGVRSALIYPTILLAVVGLSVVVLLTVVLPQFRTLFEEAGQSLPLMTRFLLAAGDFLVEWGWAMVAGLLALALLARRQMARPAARERLDALVLRLPLVGTLVRRYETALFSRTLAMLVRNGLTLPAALVIAKETVGNSVLTRALDGVLENLKEGRGFAQPLMATRAFPNLVGELAQVGEETGRLDDMLLKAADIYDAEVQRAMERLLAILVPALTLLLGGLVAAVLGSVLGAILSVNELAQ